MQRFIDGIVEVSMIAMTLACGGCGKSEASSAQDEDTGLAVAESGPDAESDVSPSGLVCEAGIDCPDGETCWYLATGCDAVGHCGVPCRYPKVLGHSCSCSSHATVFLECANIGDAAGTLLGSAHEPVTGVCPDHCPPPVCDEPDAGLDADDDGG